MSVQNHCHIGSGAGSSPEYSPPKYKTIRRRRRTYVIASPRRTETGKLIPHVLQGGGGPAVFTDFVMTLRLTLVELETLKGELGKVVYFIDHDHPNDGSNHTDYRREMLLGAFVEEENIENSLASFLLTVELTDNFTVT